ncbi:MAG: hypothetical protein ACLT4C_09835 [Butyricicoccus sp.]
MPWPTVRSVWSMTTLRSEKAPGLTPKQKLVLQILVAGVFIRTVPGSSGLPRGFRSRDLFAGRGRCI